MNVSSILLSKEHIQHPLTITAQNKVISIADKKTKAVALSVFIGLLTLGIGGVIAFYYFTAKYKVAALKGEDKQATLVKRIIRKIDFDPEKKISNGSGEFIAYKKTAEGKKEPLSEESYSQVFDILLQYAPSSIQSAPSKEEWIKEFENRKELISEKIKDIDPNIEITFIPRTLYELFFLHESIEEDLTARKICTALQPNDQYTLHYPKFDSKCFREIPEEKMIEMQKKMKQELDEKKCWHRCYFDDAGIETKEVKQLAFRINQVALEKLGDLPEVLTFQEINRLVHRELAYLKRLYNHVPIEVSNCNNPGPTTNFGFESTRGSIKPMGIRNDDDAQIVLNTVALECDELAKRHFILYRGANFQKEKPYNKENHPFSLSYGSSLFAGVMFDAGATAFHYMRDQEKDAFAVKVPFEELENSPFYAPLTHPICQLFGHGEIFHGRSKAWEGVERKPGGLQQGESRWDHLKSHLSEEAFKASFQKYQHENMVFIK